MRQCAAHRKLSLTENILMAEALSLITLLLFTGRRPAHAWRGLQYSHSGCAGVWIVRPVITFGGDL